MSIYMRYEVLRLITSTAFTSNTKSSGRIFSEGLGFFFPSSRSTLFPAGEKNARERNSAARAAEARAARSTKNTCAFFARP